MQSEVQFKVEHPVISTMTGSFNSFSGSALIVEDLFENAQVKFVVDINSVNNGQHGRNEHLRLADFFDAVTYPEFKFVSSTFSKSDQDLYKLNGGLTIKGITGQIELDAECGGTEPDLWGNIKVGFRVTGIIDRKDLNITFNSLTEAGGLLLGEKIKSVANIQLSKEVPS